MQKYYLVLNKLFFYPEKLIEESKKLEWSPFEKATGKTGNFFDHVPDWLTSKIDNIIEFPEVERIHRILEYVTESKDIRPRFYRQKKNFEIPPHKDLNTTCAVNFLVSQEPGPITFTDIGDIYYKVALLNLQQEHSVKKSEGERILLKFSFFDVSYEECKDKLKIFA